MAQRIMRSNVPYCTVSTITISIIAVSTIYVLQRYCKSVHMPVMAPMVEEQLLPSTVCTVHHCNLMAYSTVQLQMQQYKNPGKMAQLSWVQGAKPFSHRRSSNTTLLYWWLAWWGWCLFWMLLLGAWNLWPGSACAQSSKQNASPQHWSHLCKRLLVSNCFPAQLLHPSPSKLGWLSRTSNEWCAQRPLTWRGLPAACWCVLHQPGFPLALYQAHTKGNTSEIKQCNFHYSTLSRAESAQHIRTTQQIHYRNKWGKQYGNVTVQKYKSKTEMSQ